MNFSLCLETDKQLEYATQILVLILVLLVNIAPWIAHFRDSQAKPAQHPGKDSSGLQIVWN